MSHKNYSEYEMTEAEITQWLEELYPEDVEICGQKFSQAYALKRLDRISFDMVCSDMDYWQCDECGTIYRDDDAMDKAKECCQEFCSECDEPMIKSENCDDENAEMCWSCQAEEDSEEE